MHAKKKTTYAIELTLHDFEAENLPGALRRCAMVATDPGSKNDREWLNALAEKIDAAREEG